jgi:hypothetical protein
VESEIEIRQVFDPGDFGPALTPELKEAEGALTGLHPQLYESVHETGTF